MTNLKCPHDDKDSLMNLQDPELERTLRQAPRPLPPATLRETLVAQITLPKTPHCVAGVDSLSSPWRPRSAAVNWWRRWWPALAPAALSVACVVTVAVQQMEINDLRRLLEPLVAALPVDQYETSVASVPSVAPVFAASAESDELARLHDLVDRLAAEIAALENLQAENESLRASRSGGSGLAVTADERAALAAAYERAQVITCINNLKQLGLAAHIWAKDHNDMFPSSLSDLSAQLSASVMVCPVDAQAGSQRPYEYLRPGAEAYKEPNLVLFRCPNHGNICIGDGSAHMKVAKDRPEHLVERDGVLYYEPNSSAPAETQDRAGEEP